jgi:hypothetical protein
MAERQGYSTFFPAPNVSKALVVSFTWLAKKTVPDDWRSERGIAKFSPPISCVLQFVYWGQCTCPSGFMALELLYGSFQPKTGSIRPAICCITATALRSFKLGTSDRYGGAKVMQSDQHMRIATAYFRWICTSGDKNGFIAVYSGWFGETIVVC